MKESRIVRWRTADGGTRDGRRRDVRTDTTDPTSGPSIAGAANAASGPAIPAGAGHDTGNAGCKPKPQSDPIGARRGPERLRAGARDAPEISLEHRTA